ncbi:MAG: alanine--tRNA ligase, partial [Armatimonadetes bacterium]|nr:alanine--tRNA ligase [Armatimonadota bacterium]
MTGDQIRQRFLDFFATKEHLVLPSAKLLPDDPTTYFTTAGMQPFVPYFLGNERPPAVRLATCQKCLRADDLDEVGYTARHLSFFEMLGNFSLGDYFKREAIAWGWEFMLQGLELDPERLWVTVYQADDEAAEIWAEHVGVPRERIIRFGMDDNWWGPVGNSGPCGPCSEILLDRGAAWGDAETPLEDEGGDRYIELWNLVFQQYNSAMSKADLKATGTIPVPLPKPGIDTGAGLERVAVALQGVSTVFETDLLQPLCKAVIGIANERGGSYQYGVDREVTAAVNRIADHTRALTFTICDGMFPSNKAAGYVLRQILRRAARFGRLRLGLSEPFIYRLSAAVAERYGDTYPEVREGLEAAQALIRQEEERFGEALNHGIPRLEEVIENLAGDGRATLPGDLAFHLYETYGVPIEVQVEVAQERGLTVDIEAFEAQRAGREKSAIAAGFEGHGDFADDLLGEVAPTSFSGYQQERDQARVVALVLGAVVDETRGLITGGRSVDETAAVDDLTVVLDRTPFYAEGGGQVGDQGWLIQGADQVEVIDTKRENQLIV